MENSIDDSSIYADIQFYPNANICDQRKHQKEMWHSGISKGKCWRYHSCKKKSTLLYTDFTITMLQSKMTVLLLDHNHNA